MSSKLEQRERLVIALLETLNDPYELPRSSPADAGPAPSKRVPCDVCLRSGRLMRDTFVKGQIVILPGPCGSCGGTGWRRRRKSDQEWDEYLNLPVSTAGTVVKTPPRPFRLDEDIRRLWFELERLGREDDPDPDALLRALQAKDWLEKRGSYKELRRTLALLERRSQCVHGAVWRRYVRGIPVRASGRFETLVSVGVAFLAREMRGEIRVPHAFQQAHAEERVKGVAELAAAGLGARKIAAALSMPLYKVKRILRDTRSVAPSDAPATVGEAESAFGLESGA